MLQNYLKIALRNLRKHRGYAFINISGLAVGLTCCLLLFLYVRHEWSYDRFHENAGQAYRVAMGDFDGQTPEIALSAAPLGPVLLQDYPDVTAFVRLHPNSSTTGTPVRYEDKLFFEERFAYAETSLFQIFTLPMLKGNPETALTAPRTIILTETLAEKYFGEEDPMGKVLLVGGSTGYTVTATGQGDQANDDERGVTCTMVLTVNAANPNGLRTPADCWN